MNRPAKILPNEIQTIHNLDFEVAEWKRDKAWKQFKVGTCYGLWRCTEKSYEILSIKNESPGNGHFEDVLQWFEHSCRRDGKTLKILETRNKSFKIHLVTKRGFKAITSVDLEKEFK